MASVGVMPSLSRTASASCLSAGSTRARIILLLAMAVSCCRTAYHNWGTCKRHRANEKSPAETRRGFCSEYRERECSVLGRPGSDLLFQALRLSTIGAEDFDGRVRDGIGYGLLAMTTRSAKDRNQASVISNQKRLRTLNSDYEASDLSRHPASASAI